jgi:hypothetical protein
MPIKARLIKQAKNRSGTKLDGSFKNVNVTIEKLNKNVINVFIIMLF